MYMKFELKFFFFSPFSLSGLLPLLSHLLLLVLILAILGSSDTEAKVQPNLVPGSYMLSVMWRKERKVLTQLNLVERKRDTQGVADGDKMTS